MSYVLYFLFYVMICYIITYYINLKKAMLLYSSVLCNVILCYVISIFYEGLHFLCSDSDPGVAHIPEPVPESSSCEGNQGSALNLLDRKSVV